MVSRQLPPIPQIDGVDLTLAVFTHRSLVTQSDDYISGERLAELGEKVLQLAVADHLFRKKPSLSAEQIGHESSQVLSDDNYKLWIDSYGLRSKLVFNPTTTDNPLQDPAELKILFHTYIGAVFLRSGFDDINNWISQLLDPNQPPPSLPDYQPSGSHQFPYHQEPPVPRADPPPLPPPPNNPPNASFGTLQSFHEFAAKKGLNVTYQAQSVGQSHLPTWTVRCFVNGEEKGWGQGKNQKIAKEEAAKQTYQLMGW